MFSSKSFTGRYQQLGSSRTTTQPVYSVRPTQSSQSSQSSQNSNDILYAIVTQNLSTVRRLVNASNINQTIDETNGYTALHHAVRVKKNDAIVEYLLSCQADVNMKTGDGSNCDAIDLAIEVNYRFLIDKILKKKDTELDELYTKYDNLNYKVKDVEKNCAKLESTNENLTNINYGLTKSNEEQAIKINGLKMENTELKIENTELKRKLSESNTAFGNLLKKNKK